MNLEQEEAQMIARLRAAARQVGCPSRLEWDETRGAPIIVVDVRETLPDPLQKLIHNAVAAFNQFLS